MISTVTYRGQGAPVFVERGRLCHGTIWHNGQSKPELQLLLDFESTGVLWTYKLQQTRTGGVLGRW